MGGDKGKAGLLKTAVAAAAAAKSRLSTITDIVTERPGTVRKTRSALAVTEKNHNVCTA